MRVAPYFTLMKFQLFFTCCINYLQIYNFKRADFPTLLDFNNYLERFETIVMNLTYNIDVEETEAEISRFKAENSELIEKNKRKVHENEYYHVYREN